MDSINASASCLRSSADAGSLQSHRSLLCMLSYFHGNDVYRIYGAPVLYYVTLLCVSLRNRSDNKFSLVGNIEMTHRYLGYDERDMIHLNFYNFPLQACDFCSMFLHTYSLSNKKRYLCWRCTSAGMEQHIHVSDE